MSGTLARQVFGSSKERHSGAHPPRVVAINALETELAALSDEALRARTEAFKKEIAAGKSGDDLRRNDR